MRGDTYFFCSLYENIGGILHDGDCVYLQYSYRVISREAMQSGKPCIWCPLREESFESINKRMKLKVS